MIEHFGDNAFISSLFFPPLCYDKLQAVVAAACREGHPWTRTSIPALIQDTGIYNCLAGDPLVDYGCPPQAVICLIRENGPGAM